MFYNSPYNLHIKPSSCTGPCEQTFHGLYRLYAITQVMVCLSKVAETLKIVTTHHKIGQVTWEPQRDVLESKKLHWLQEDFLGQSWSQGK